MKIVDILNEFMYNKCIEVNQLNKLKGVVNYEKHY